MQAFKSVWQYYTPSDEILGVLEEFRKMVNDCIRIGLAENVTSLKALSKKTYHQLERYPVSTRYRLTATSKATGILRTYRQTLRKHPNTKQPYADKLMLTDYYTFKISNGQLRLVVRPKHYVYIQLNDHVLRSVSGFTVRSVTLTACTLSLAFSKEIATADVAGLIGIDRNLDNVTTATDKGNTKRFALSGATRIKTIYREVKSHFKRNDKRIRTKIFSKYGRKQRNRVNQRLNLVSHQIVIDAKADNQGIVMEDLKGIRNLYKRGNGQGRKYRSRLNSWSFYELQRQIEYKAKWEGIPVVYVHPQRTSSVCAICGSSIIECTERKVFCQKCNRTTDRDENAALNIVKRGMRFVPIGLAGEAMVKESSKQVLLTVDASKLTQRM